ncbi:MAG: Cof-type HAD-IIB family hydrolase [Planctomycetota bacterium]|nr:Cof-type HAD-IIB family hydrolase [Planctomycetota bacterium]
MKKIRLIALDIDGTLLNDDKNVPPENLRALREARDAGVQVAISSGRMIPTIEPVEEMLEVDTVIIAYNGGKVVGPRAQGRPVIDHRPVPVDVAEEFIGFSTGQGYLLNFYHEDRLYADETTAARRFMDVYSGRTGSRYHLVDLNQFRGVEPTKMILLAAPEERDRLYERFSREYGERASISRSDPEYLEIMAPGVTKGSALPVLAAHYGFTTEEILAVGDADNDNEMLEIAGLGVAVANARPSTKEIADVVTERTNNEGAIAEAVYRFALGGSPGG